MSAPVDHDLAARLRVAEKRWLDDCASRLRRAAARPGFETAAGATTSTSGEEKIQ